MLRESGKIEKRSYNLNGTIDPTVDSGVDHGNVLFDFAIAVASNKPDLDGARDALVTAMGSPAVVTASLTAATFSLLDRIANGIGISLDAPVLQGSADFREELGINAYPSAANSLR